MTDLDMPAGLASDAADEAAMKEWAELLVAQARAEGVEVSFDSCAEFRHPFFMQVGLGKYRCAMFGQFGKRDHHSGEVVRHSLLEQMNPGVGHDSDASSCQQFRCGFALEFAKTRCRSRDFGIAQARQRHPVIAAPPHRVGSAFDGSDNLRLVKLHASAHRACVRDNADRTRVGDDDVVLHEHAHLRHIFDTRGEP